MPNPVKSRELFEAEQMTASVCGLSLRLMEAIRNGRPLSVLSPAEQLTLSWILGNAEAVVLERERVASTKVK